jgi:hypothetical protein
LFCLLRNGWDATMIYGIDTEKDKFLIYEHDQWEWVPMDEFKPIN